MIPKKIYLFSISSHPDAISINSLAISFFQPSIDFLELDYFIITSKQTSESLKQYPSNILKPALCISKATAKAYRDIGGKILEIGSGYGDDLALKIKEYPKSTRWLYLRAKVVASDFVLRCQEENYLIDEVIMYESRCSDTIQNVLVEDDAVLIFTSPSSVNCFLKKHKISSLHKVIVIGKTTALSLPKNTKYQISEKKNIESCFARLLHTNLFSSFVTLNLIQGLVSYARF